MEEKKFSVRHDNSFLSHHIVAGVSQGSDPPSDLYNIYTIDIPQIPDTLLATFADDMAQSHNVTL